MWTIPAFHKFSFVIENKVDNNNNVFDYNKKESPGKNAGFVDFEAGEDGFEVLLVGTALFFRHSGGKVIGTVPVKGISPDSAPCPNACPGDSGPPSVQEAWGALSM